MVIVRLMGGLGNQMFQYAAARATSLRTGSPLKVDLSWFDDEGSSVTPRRVYELEPFGLSLELASEAEIARTLRRRIFRRRPRILVDPTLRFDPRVLEAGDVRLIGYWQSEKYFADHADTIRRDFALPTVDAALEDRLASVESVSVHVRRGDYASDSSLRLGARRAAARRTTRRRSSGCSSRSRSRSFSSSRTIRTGLRRTSASTRGTRSWHMDEVTTTCA